MRSAAREQHQSQLSTQLQRAHVTESQSSVSSFVRDSHDMQRRPHEVRHACSGGVTCAILAHVRGWEALFRTMHSQIPQPATRTFRNVASGPGSQPCVQQTSGDGRPPKAALRPCKALGGPNTFPSFVCPPTRTFHKHHAVHHPAGPHLMFWAL